MLPSVLDLCVLFKDAHRVAFDRFTERRPAPLRTADKETSARSCSARRENGLHNSDSAHGRLHFRNAAPFIGEANRRQKKFLQEVVKEVRVRGSNCTLTYKLPLRMSESQFFTPLKLVGPPGLEPGTNRL